MIFKSFFFFLLILKINCFQHISGPRPKIFLGVKDATKNVPYMVQLYNVKDNVLQCGGVIIDNFHILTDGSCIRSVEKHYLRIVVGTNSFNNHNNFGVISIASQFKVHEKYQFDSSNNITFNNIGLIKLNTPLKFNERIKPVKIRSTPLRHELVKISGFGKDEKYKESSHLLSAVVPVIDSKLCQERSYYSELNPPLTKDEFCAGKGEQHHSTGDTGSPAVDLHGELVGIKTWSDNFGIGPGIYTNVINYRDWILNHSNYEEVKENDFYSVNE